MTLGILRLSDLPVSLWANGAGETVEYWRLADAAAPGGFAARISLARIAGDQDFSRFPGIDRHIVQIDGDPVVLTIAGQAAAMIPGQPMAFAGEVAVSARVAGSARDLNLMCRRGQWRGGMTALTLRAGAAPDLRQARHGAVFAIDPLHLSDGRSLAPGDMTLGGWPAELTAQSPARVIVMTLRA